jgi:predicted ester cyclase
MNSTPGSVSGDLRSIAIRSILLMADGERGDFDEVVDPNATDRENVVQPPASRVPGPAGFYATALWLRAAYADLHYEIHHAVADGEIVAVNSTMSGRQVAPFVVYDADGEVETAFPPTGKTFATTQSHWFRIEDGKILEHWANRDDLGTAQQLGWVPPTPVYLVKMARAKRRAQRTATVRA